MRCTISIRCSTASRASRAWPSWHGRWASRQPLLLQSMYLFKQPQHRRRGRLAPGRDLSAHRARHRDRLLDRARRRRPRQRLPDGAAGRPSRAVAQALPPRRRCHGDRRRSMRRPGRQSSRWRSRSRRGTLVVLHGLLPHASSANRSARPRHAYTLHLIDGARVVCVPTTGCNGRTCHCEDLRDSQGRASLPSRRLRSRPRWRASWRRATASTCRPACSAPTGTMSGGIS